MPFLNLHMSPERMLRGMDSDKSCTLHHSVMTGVSGAMASIVLLVMTVVFMLFECVRAFIVRFRAKQSTNPYCRHARALRRLALSGAENAARFMDGRDYLAGTGVNGYSVCANVGRTAFFAQLRS